MKDYKDKILSFMERQTLALEQIVRNTTKATPNPKPKKTESYSDAFDAFWKRFKGRWIKEKSHYIKGSKLEGWISWKTLAPEEQTKAHLVAPHCGSEITQDCCRWLGNKRFNDDHLAEHCKPKPKAIDQIATCDVCGKAGGVTLQLTTDKMLCRTCWNEVQK